MPDNTPIRYKVLVLSGLTFLLINNVKMVPKKKQIQVIIMVLKREYSLCNEIKDKGIKSVILIKIIMPKENERHKGINLLVFFGLTNINKQPKTVDKPAIEDNIKGNSICILFHQ